MERPVSCPSCRRGIFADDAFCSSCGTRTQPRDGGTGASRRARVERTVATAEREACASCNSLLLPGDLFCATCGARRHTDAGDVSFNDAWADIPGEVTRSTDGKYEFVRELGRGGMGIVFLARDRELERLVAIKVLSPSWVTDDSMLKRFQREARTIARLRHESIITVYAEGRAGGLSYFVMDYIEGVSVSRILRAHGALPIPVVEAILYRVGSGLDYAHRPGREIVHRDVKPSNIMVDSEGQAVLMDFGISREVQGNSGLTKTGMVIGTPEYMSPEQCRGHQVTPSSDQYSLGAVAYAMITGAPPFTGPFYQVLMAHGSEPPPPIMERRPDCPEPLARTVERMLAKHPTERWPGIRDALNSAELRPLPQDDPAVQELAAMVHVCWAREDGTAAGDGRAEAPRTPSSIRIMPLPNELEVGDEFELEARALFPDGAEEPWGDVSWRSADPSVAEVDAATGQVRAVGSGSAVITAEVEGIEEALQLEIRPPRVVEVAIEPRGAEVSLGESLRLSAQPRSKRGDPLVRRVSWASSDPRTATVSEDGVVTPHQPGRVVVLGHCDGVGGSTEITIAVGRDAPTGPAPSSRSSAPGVATPSAPGVPSTPSTPEPGPSHPPTPAPTPLPATARTAAAGTGTGTGDEETGRRIPPVVWIAVVAVGIVAFWLAWGGLSPGGDPGPLDLVIRTAEGEVGAAGLDAAVGDTVSLAALAVAEDGAELDLSVSWSSSDPAVATVDPTGIVIALAEGTARIVVDADEGRREVPLTVGPPAGPPAVADVVIRTAQGAVGGGGLSARVGDTRALSATVSADDGTQLDRSVAWSSSNPGVAQVSTAGIVTARAAGTARIRVEVEGVTREVAVTVEAAQVEERRPVQEGTLVLRIAPSWASVRVNGQAHGDRTLLELSLPAGDHRIQLDHPSMQPVDTTFTLQPGVRHVMDIRMQGGTQ